MRTSRTFKIAVLLVALCMLAASTCKKKETIAPDVIARIGERTLTLEDFKRYLSRNAGTELAQIAPQASSALLDQYIEETLIAEYAGSHGTEVSAEKIATAVRSDAGSTVMDKRDEMRRADFLHGLAQRLPEPTDAAVEQYYNQHLQEFTLPDRVRARQILLHDGETANKAMARLAKGDDFADVARDFSEAPNGKVGGDIGFVGRGQLPKTFEDVLFALKPGAVSNVIKADDSFHIFKVEEFAAAGPIPLGQASATIRARLQEDAMDAEVARVVGEAREELPVKVFSRRLPFPYGGTWPTSDE